MPFTKCNPSRIPADIQDQAKFCLWKYGPPRLVQGEMKKPKWLYDPATHRMGKSNDPGTFTDFRNAVAAGEGHAYDGLGIGMFGNLAGIDIDHCFLNGELTPMALDIINAMDAYTEISPSDEGIRLFFLVPAGFSYDTTQYYIKNSTLGLELYIAGMTNRFLTITGNVLRSRDLADRSDRLQAILDKYMKRPAQPIQAAAAPVPVEIELSDTDLLDKAKNAANGEQFTALWNGDYKAAGYGSQSEADLALCNQLAFWARGDAARIDRLFRQSGLYRKKWEREAYRTGTIQKAIASCRSFYNPQAQQQPRQAQGGKIMPDQQPRNPGRTEAQDAGPQEMAQNAPQKPGTPVDAQIPTEAPEAPQNAIQAQKTPVQLFDSFLEKIQTETFRPLKTGMAAFDSLLGGGILRQSLVILTAAPGTGKTTLAQQIFETMAACGNDVIFFNLEMSRDQLLARSLARIVYKNGHKIPPTGILQGYSWTAQQKAFILEAAAEYRARIADRMQYNPPGAGTDLERIINTLNAAGEKAKAEGKQAPVCVLDYLHLITTSKREEQAEIIKKAVAALKAYAIQYDTFVFAISANNRTANTSGIISLESGRDTSAIEYTADYQLALNYRELAESKSSTGKKYSASNPDDMDELAQKSPRNMLIQVLKNRMGKQRGKLYLEFNGEASTFTPCEGPKKQYGFTEITKPDPDNPYIL